MANFINSREKERVQEKVTEIFDHLEPNIKKRAVRNLVSIFEDIYIKHEELENSKVSNAEIKLLLQEMRAGFELMEQRFEAVDKRFEAVDKRFEAVDNRFEDLIHYMDKRFDEQMHFMNKRFEDLTNYFDKRFSANQWFMGIGFSILLTVLIVIFAFLSKLI